MTSIKLFTVDEYTTGFEVTYEPPEGPEFEGWPIYKKLFGYDGEEARRRLASVDGGRRLQSVDEQELSLDNDISLFQVCIDEDSEESAGL